LERRHQIINADVLDAWFPPSPKVLEVLQEHLPWLLRTSPPTGCEGLIEAIAEARGVGAENILPGGGSSDLIFRALRTWLKAASHALILDPTYGEYAHVLERVIGCTVDRLTLARKNHYQIDLARLEAALADNYDLVVLVNPNSPTGRHIPRSELEAVLRRAPGRTRVWVDETYVEYAGAGQSLESFAARSENIIVCKSMSKVYALSGARVAYLCAGPHQLEELRAITPPWVVVCRHKSPPCGPCRTRIITPHGTPRLTSCASNSLMVSVPSTGKQFPASPISFSLTCPKMGRTQRRLWNNVASGDCSCATRARWARSLARTRYGWR
jgi:histidinol-phosphate/aromatic aminotransferase/cobyric acid decarboxylase-like protein